jgi:hypothetical protein
VASINIKPSKPVQTKLQTFSPKSSFIAALEYDEQNLTLTTHMINGAIYQHKFVLPSDWQGLQTSQNHGKFWSRAIEGKKQSVRVKIARSPNSLLRGKK